MREKLKYAIDEVLLGVNNNLGCEKNTQSNHYGFHFLKSAMIPFSPHRRCKRTRFQTKHPFLFSNNSFQLDRRSTTLLGRTS